MTASDSKNELNDVGRTISRNSFFTAIYNVVYLVSRLALTPFILANISIGEYGIWSYCFLLLGYMGATGLGFSYTYIRYAADFQARDERDRLNQLISTGMISLTVFSLATFPFLYYFAPSLLDLLGVNPELRETATGLFIGSAALFMANFSLSGFQYVLEGVQKIDVVRKIQTAASLIEIAFIVMFFLLGLGVFSLLWAYAVRVLFILCLNIRSAYKLIPDLEFSFRHFKKDSLSKFARFGGQIQILSFLSLLIHSIDRIILSRLMHMEALGLYEAGRKLPNTGMMLPAAIAGVFMPAAAHLEGKEQGNKIRFVYLFGTRYLMLSSTLGYLFLFLFAGQIIEVWLGAEYAQVVPIMQVLALGTLINLSTGVGTSCMRGVGKPKCEIQYMTVSAVLLIVMSPVFINYFGLVGAAYAFTIAQTIGSLYFLKISNAMLRVNFQEFARWVILPSAVCLVGAVPSWVFCRIIWDSWVSGRVSGLLVLGLISAIYLAVCGLCFYLFRERLLFMKERRKISRIDLIQRSLRWINRSRKTA